MNRQNALQKHLNDMMAAEEHILNVVRRQREDDTVKNHVEANKTIIEIERVLSKHVETLDQLTEQYGVSESLTKEAVSKALGFAAGLYDKVRGDHPVSRDLRDNYTALSLAAMAYTSLHTFALAVDEERLATVAQNHLEDLTPLMVEISRVLPGVVATEVAEEVDFPTDATAGQRARENTQRAWSPEVTNQHSAAS